MRKDIAFFAQLIGSHIWNGTRSFGTYLTFEFGSPHIRFREPKPETDTMSPKINRIYRRRKVELIGDWSVWLQECNWILSFRGLSLRSAEIGARSTDADLADLNDLIMYIDGQKLIDVSFDDAKQEVMFHFDLGGAIRFSHSAQPDGPHWSLYSGADLIFEEGGHNG